MTLSIIIPVYNVAPYLERCLDSVLVDNHFMGQVICVNDGSTDSGPEILRHYSSRHPNVQIITQKNAGLSVARNVGFDHATGEYVFFLDSDDWVIPGMIEQVLHRIDNEDVLYFNARRFYEETNSWDENCPLTEIKDVTGSDYFTMAMGQKRNMAIVCVGGGFYRRQFLLENKLYNEPGLYHEDNYFTPQVLLAAKHVSCVDECLYAYRIRKGSITASVTEKHVKDMLFVARNLYSLYESRQNVYKVFYTDVKNLYLQLINDAYENGIRLGHLWRQSDSRTLAECADDTRSRRVAKLSMLSTKLSFFYMQEQLPGVIRRGINRFL